MTSKQQNRYVNDVSHPAKPSLKTRLIKEWKSAVKNPRKSHSLHLAIVILIALIAVFYFYNKSNSADNTTQAQTGTNLNTTAEVVKQVSKHILLPTGEQPTVATVSDSSKVRGQSFFANAANGDKVLIYAQAKKAYLYRPSVDRLIEVAPLAPNGSGQ